jgi:hypothetical protein
MPVRLFFFDAVIYDTPLHTSNTHYLHNPLTRLPVPEFRHFALFPNSSHSPVKKLFNFLSISSCDSEAGIPSQTIVPRGMAKTNIDFR